MTSTPPTDGTASGPTASGAPTANGAGASAGAAEAPEAVFTGYPLRTRIVVVIVLFVAIGGFILAGFSADTDNSDTVAISGSPGQRIENSDGVEIQVPGDGSEVLSQQPFGIDLAPGWTGELQLLPSNGPAIQIPEDQLDRTTEINQVLFFPGEDKVIQRLPGGNNCVKATIWNQVRGRAATERVETWCFSVN